MSAISSCKALYLGRVQKVLLLTAVLVCSVVPARTQSQLPEGRGKEIVQKACTGCHGVEWVMRKKYDKESWRNLVNHMAYNMATMPYNGPLPTKDEIAAMTEYFTKNFLGSVRYGSGATAPVSPAQIPGNVEASVKEWTLPTPKSFPHDTLVMPDGSIWYTGLAANVVGRFDPKTEQFKEYHLPAKTAPHGLVPDKDGNIWFTATFGDFVGKLDAKTGEVKKYPITDPNAYAPHTPIFDQKGTLWFTFNQASKIGRLIPKTGEMKIVTPPTAKGGPYGIVVSSKGIPFFAEFYTNKLASIDPDTMEIHEYAVPNAGARPRRIAITADDIIWYTDFARGYLGRFDPKTGKFSEWLSPSGPKSAPYGITVVGNIVWYSESETKPNTIVRFDPQTEKFQTWLIPSGGGGVHFITHSSDGNLWFGCSRVSRLGELVVRKTSN